MEACPHDVLKKSLSETLTRYYPLAGRIKTIALSLTELLAGADHPAASGFNSKVVLAVQVNIFDGGGIVIGVHISHKIADASSFITFIKDWAATARGAIEQIKSPSFEDLPSLFPQRDLMGFKPESIITNRGEKIVAKKFLFRDSKIAELKKRSMITGCHHVDDVQEYPTRVEALSALIWRCFMDVNQGKEEGASSAAAGVRVYGVVHGVNMRTRMVPPLPTNSIGNMYNVAIALSDVSDNADDDDDQGEQDYHQYSNLVAKIRDAIKRIDDKQVRELQTTDAFLNCMKQVTEYITSSQAVLLYFTSWCRFPIYEADFGWGKPIWVTMCKSPIKNVVWLVDTSSGEGIEALVSLTKEDMAKFESHEKLLAFTS
ncbi:Transferase [Macleaya cordata]|uniref:Transferase n=1 Tax=Macleaya cordata TaxID=56857 RepID=A0A200QMY6_MACCD|nr:Transferase [Macleaya cordata]